MVGGFLCKEIVPFTTMIVLEAANVGVNTLFKAATSKGMNFYVFSAYSSVVSCLILLPFVLYFHRRAFLHPLSSSIIGKICTVGAIGATCLMLTFKGIEYSSPTLASAMSNLIPTFTFILAIIFRMEKISLRISSSQAKIFGTLISIMGALVVILYKGSPILFTSSKSAMTQKLLYSTNSNWIIGGVLLCVGYILTPASFVLQAHILEEYPTEFIVVFLYGGFAALVLVTISTVVVPYRNSWTLKPDISMVAILCSGTSLTITGVAMSWIVRRKGPFYIAMFKPLSIAIAVVMGIICLDDTLYVGSIVGGSMIAFGFYSLMWGKLRESYEDLENAASDACSNKTPFLQNSQNLESENC